MRISFKKSIAAIAAAAAVICIITAALHFTKPRTFTAAFYDVPGMTAAALTVQLRNILESSESGSSRTIKLVTVSYSAEESIGYYLTRKPLPDIVFTFAGKSAESAALFAQQQNSGIHPSILQSMPVSIQKTALRNQNSQITAVPLLLDHYEIAVRRSEPSNGQFIFAGADDKVLLSLAGCIAEAAFGIESAKQLAADMEKAAAADLGKAVTADIPLMRETAKLIAAGIRSGRIPPYVFQITAADAASLIENGTPGSVFMPLSFHRTVPFRGTKQYEAVFFPSFTGTGNRALTVPVLYAIPLARKKASLQTAETVLHALSSADIQYALSADAGLAPVNSRAETADIQAADVRYWAAAAQIIPPLATAAFSNAQQQKTAADQLRALISEYINADTP